MLQSCAVLKNFDRTIVLHAPFEVQPNFCYSSGDQCTCPAHECRSTKHLRVQVMTVMFLYKRSSDWWPSQTRDRDEGETHAGTHAHLR
jgi:hypothetical protein